MKLTKREGEVVDEARDICRRYAESNMCIVSSTQYPLRVIRACIAKGLIEETGDVVIVDGDGFAKEPERYRAGYRLTDLGRAVAAEREKSADEARRLAWLATETAKDEGKAKR